MEKSRSIVKNYTSGSARTKCIQKFDKVRPEPKKLKDPSLITVANSIKGFCLINAKNACRNIVLFTMGNAFYNIDQDLLDMSLISESFLSARKYDIPYLF